MFAALKQMMAARMTGDMAVLARIMREIAAPHWPRIAIGFALTGVASSITALTAYLLGTVVNALYVAKSFPGVVGVSLAIIVLCTLKGLAVYGHAIMLAQASHRIVAELQCRMFDKLLHEGLGYIQNRQSTDLMASVSHGTTAITGIINLMVSAVGRDLLTLFGLCAVMVVQDPVLSMIGLCFLPLALGSVQKLVRKAVRIATTQFTGSAAIMHTMQETIQGFRVIKAFNMEDRLRVRMEADVRSVETASNKMAKVANRTAPLIEALGGMAIGAACLYGGYRILQTNAAPGEFVAFMTAFLLAFDPARRLARLNIDLSSNLVAAKSLFAQLDSPPSEPDEHDKPSLRAPEGAVTFEGVGFSYRPGQVVLRDLSFTANARQVTALVGPSGGGKSTVLNLLLRLYEVQSGSICIDGQTIVAHSRHSLRSQISYVGQDVYLFGGSIRDNILTGRPSASEDEMIAAAKAAFAHDFIAGFPQGYDTQVGEFGWQLSLGQRQRVALARALIKDAPIVLLDEATASLDSESEHQVQLALARLCAGKTTIVIAHRLNTIRDAACIHVIEGGTIVESGRHEDLLARGGRYEHYFRLQFRRPEDDPSPTAAASAGPVPTQPVTGV